MTYALTSQCEIYPADFTDWMSFLPSNPMEETARNQGALSKNN